MGEQEEQEQESKVAVANHQHEDDEDGAPVDLSCSSPTFQQASWPSPRRRQSSDLHMSDQEKLHVSALLLVLHCFPRWWKVYGRRNLRMLTGGEEEEEEKQPLCRFCVSIKVASRLFTPLLFVRRSICGL